MSDLPIGVRNHNPCNLRPGQPYEGLATPAEIGGFCNFISNVFGFRSPFRNYITKSDRGINTIRKLITEWSPPADNTSPSDPDGTKSTAAYIASVCTRSGYGADDVINLKDWNVASVICYAQTIHENGSFEPYFTMAQMAQGAFRAGIVNAPLPLVQHVAARVAASGAGISAAVTVVQPVVESWQGLVHSPTLQIIFASFAAALAGISAAIKPKAAQV